MNKNQYSSMENRERCSSWECMHYSPEQCSDTCNCCEVCLAWRCDTCVHFSECDHVPDVEIPF